MENLTKEQKKLFYKFIKNIKDENSLKQLEQFLDLIENNAIQNSLKDIAEFNSVYKGNGNNEEMSIKDMIEDIKIRQKDIDEIYWKIFDIQSDNKNESSALIEIEKAKEYADRIKSDYEKFYDQNAQGNVTKGIISKLEQACGDIEENKDKIKEFEEFYNKIFIGVEADENGKNGKLSLEKYLDEKRTEINNLISSKKQELGNCLNDYKDKFENLYKEKNDKIDELLPGATSKGLAEAYKDEKEDMQENIKKWNGIFIGSIVLFITLFVIYFIISLNKDFTFASFFRAFPFLFFSGFFTYYSTKQIAEYKRIASEYAYKQRLNQTYKGYETQIKEANNEELKNQLLRIMLDSAENNPSKILDKKGEIPSLSVIEKMLDILPFDTLKRIQDKIKAKIEK
ncbi:hypothetical protein IYO87_001590 [Campylobacter jejuni]|uniref:hypothetical protein n=1 Tax=Campylobacter jejuni TaxID=197 RepID=UPI00069A14F4|nr:hypothetical protein [Campylobacter jejuni]HEE9520322.1 hypothetical protein [Campylobacter jejuni subsp. jejuni]EAJ3979906.1 hypothetical protein [Campylobacter jejuni]ECP8670234.1 hypothetical protein [Campylobacter jejuni]ECR1933528.1 hypothetical protein [Campylobacter jejuni]ECR3413846.1 hypothetical protein [Campylobacter jejuni]